jgi:hypothetical protein
MISNTSTTSTSGVMLISAWRLERELSLRAVASAGSRALRDQSYAAKAGLLDRDHGLPHFTEVEFRITADHDLGLRMGCHSSAEAVAELLGFNWLIVDPQAPGIVDGDHNPVLIVALLSGLGRVRQVHVGPLVHLRHHHHEDDQQHEHHVDQRRDVNSCLHRARFIEARRPSHVP